VHDHFHRIRRRNVHHTAVFHAGSAWLIVQIAMRVFPFHDFPVCTLRATLAAVSDTWYLLELYSRKPDPAVDRVAEAPAGWFVTQPYPRQLYQARAWRMQGDSAKAKAAFSAARTQLEQWIKAAPDDAVLHANLALALAGAGENEGALREAQRAVSLRPVERDAFEGPRALLVLAQVYAETGDVDAALSMLQRLLAMPAGLLVSTHALELDPAWDPIRGDPRFHALLRVGDGTRSR